MSAPQTLTAASRRELKPKGLGVKAQKYIFVYTCLLLPLIFFIFIRIAPILYSFNISVREWDPLSEDAPFVGLDNFIHLFQDEIFRKALANTLVYVAIGVPAQLIVGLGVALLLQRATRFRGYFRVVYFIPYITSIVAISWIFRWILMPDGFANELLLSLGFEAQLFLQSPSQAIYLVIFSMVWHSIGFQMLIFIAGLENIPTLYYDAASIDGAGSWSKFRHITLPLLNPVIVFSVIIGSISFLQTFTQVLNMASASGGPLNSTVTLVLHIYNLAFKQFKMGEASAATVILFVLILFLCLLQMKLFDKKVDY